MAHSDVSNLCYKESKVGRVSRSNLVRRAFSFRLSRGFDDRVRAQVTNGQALSSRWRRRRRGASSLSQYRGSLLFLRPRRPTKATSPAHFIYLPATTNKLYSNCKWSGEFLLAPCAAAIRRVLRKCACVERVGEEKKYTRHAVINGNPRIFRTF